MDEREAVTAKSRFVTVLCNNSALHGRMNHSTRTTTCSARRALHMRFLLAALYGDACVRRVSTLYRCWGDIRRPRSQSAKSPSRHERHKSIHNQRLDFSILWIDVVLLPLYGVTFSLHSSVLVLVWLNGMPGVQVEVIFTPWVRAEQRQIKSCEQTWAGEGSEVCPLFYRLVIEQPPVSREHRRKRSRQTEIPRSLFLQCRLPTPPLTYDRPSNHQVGMKHSAKDDQRISFCNQIL
ncbi:uncharacterized protein BT62DRAFT_1011492 [Guyanagaster necrorhizus]|uniref:Uncharacterized protein n=1 Tax=Guyanagaster necrorhizus TaxID=856835 RepID=A0A9P8AN76_9AGAR|nr:uncharacterized protein BT62DRAFT_1011492 [Guyanagaster necrorhizus MCA 3950]KAG7441471.1 hypothetical protein BT62DRAFT_1011492 [Guyanagaster necrorhizus MCA 3950]